MKQLGIAESDALLRAYEAALSIASELDVDVVLQRIVDLAREIVPSRYAALGVCDDQGVILKFNTSGIDEETYARIGPPPRGEGLLGVLIRDGEPLIVPDMNADSRSVGFPPNHPPMNSMIGVPIKNGHRTLGDLYLTERADGNSFTQNDLEILQVLAAHAATAIDKAHLYQQVEAGQQAAEAQRDDLRVILDHLPTGIFIHRASDGKIEMSNESAREMTAKFSSDMASEKGYELVDAEGQELPLKDYPAQRALRGRTVRNQQMMLRVAPGQSVPVLVQAAALHSQSGNPERVVVSLQDVTQLRQAEQLKDDFLSLISHEFRTPLTAINGGAHLLANQWDALDAASRGELLLDIVSESSKLDRMLANMLSVAAIMAGRLQPARDPVLVEPLARMISKEVEDRSPSFTFRVEMPECLPLAEGDPELIGQMFRNLYENAVKYSGPGGTVLTTARAENNWIRIDVIDSGVGISPESLPHLFQRFRRPGADPTVRGMGLGLYLSRLLVEAQGGRISASSAGIGMGATFSIVLPVALEGEPTDTQSLQKGEAL